MTDQKVLGRDALLAGANNLKRKLVDVPELGGALCIRQLGADQLLTFRDRLEKMGDKEEFTISNYLEVMGMVISFSVCDEHGTLLYSNEDIPTIMENGFDVLLKLSNEILLLSNLSFNLPEGIHSEVADNLKNESKTSFSSNSQESYIKQRKRSKPSRRKST